jgi:mRNA interferase MazF
MPSSSVKRFDVFLVNLDPTIGSEIAKSRPCVVISPDEMNKHINTVLVAPLTSSVRGWPSRVPSLFEGIQGEIALDQIRAVDKRRLSKYLGQIGLPTQSAVLETLAHMFAP